MAVSNAASCAGIESAAAGKKLTCTTRQRVSGEVCLLVTIFAVFRQNCHPLRAGKSFTLDSRLLGAVVYG